MISNLSEIRIEITKICEKNGRKSDDVKLLAVSKFQSAKKIKELYDQGQRDFGENYLQELETKKALLAESCPDIRWHFIGHIQSNKAAKISQAFMVHSVGSIRHAEALNKSSDKLLPILLQLNLDEQDQRNGFSLDSIHDELFSMASLSNLHIQGLMAVLPLHSTKSPAHWFKLIKDTRDELERKSGLALPELSMGMSADYAEAIACGATWIRLGSLIFGARATS